MFKATDVIVCLGRRGSGKSYLADRISEAYPRQVIFDPTGERSDRSDGVHVHSFDEFGEAIVKADPKRFRIYYEFDVESDDKRSRAEFDEALRVIYYRGNTLIRIEEVQEFSHPHSLPHWLRKNLLLGRHQHNALIMTSQRPGECHKTLISQANHVFTGSLHDRNDIDYARTTLQDRAFELPLLPERQFLYFQPGRTIQHITNDLKNAPTSQSVKTPSESEKDDVDSIPINNPSHSSDPLPE